MFIVELKLKKKHNFFWEEVSLNFNAYGKKEKLLEYYFD